MKNPILIMPKEYKIHDLSIGIQNPSFIAQIESVVYKGENDGEEIVLKVYNMHSVVGQEHKLTLEELAFYQKITKRAKARFNGYTVKLPISEEDYKIEIVPIDLIGKINERWIGSISKFIDGKTLPLRDWEDYGEDVREKLIELSSEINLFLNSIFYIHPMKVKPKLADKKLIITDICDQIPKLQELYSVSK